MHWAQHALMSFKASRWSPTQHPLPSAKERKRLTSFEGVDESAIALQELHWHKFNFWSRNHKDSCIFLRQQWHTAVKTCNSVASIEDERLERLVAESPCKGCLEINFPFTAIYWYLLSWPNIKHWFVTLWVTLQRMLRRFIAIYCHGPTSSIHSCLCEWQGPQSSLAKDVSQITFDSLLSTVMAQHQAFIMRDSVNGREPQSSQASTINAAATPCKGNLTQ